MEITEAQVGGATVVVLVGDIDLETSPQLRSALKAVAARVKAAPASPDARLILDFTGVTYIDSSGLATLIEYYQTIRGGPARLALASVAKRVRSAFELVRLNEIFPLHESVAAALQSFPAVPNPEPSSQQAAQQ